jgi:subtilisin family serine protease
LDPSDFRVRHKYQAVPALAGKVTETGLSKLVANPNVLRIDLDVGGTGHLIESVPLIRANEQHALGFTGNGVVVAVLDTGIDSGHVDLFDDLIHEECFLDFDGSIDGTGRCPNGSDRQTGAGAAQDGAGHGTATTGIVTSRGTVSSVGVAPDAEIVAIKVLDNTGFAGTFQFVAEIVAALDFIINNRPDVNVVNMSCSSRFLSRLVC